MNLSFSRKTLDTVLETCQIDNIWLFATEVPSIDTKMS